MIAISEIESLDSSFHSSLLECCLLLSQQKLVVLLSGEVVTKSCHIKFRLMNHIQKRELDDYVHVC